MKTENRKIDQIKPYDRNPRRIPENAVDAVAESIKQFGFQQPIVVDKDGVVIAGHTRLLAAQKLGLNEVPVKVADNLTPEQVKAYRLADNKTGELADWDFEKLTLELDEIDMDMEQFGFETIEEDSVDTKHDKEEYQPERIPDTDIIEKLRNADNVIVQYSGGRDSTLVLLWAKNICSSLNKQPQALYIDTGAEFPDVTFHIIKTCKSLQIPLIIEKPSGHIVQHYLYKGIWPNQKYRECMFDYVHEPTNKYCFALDGTTVMLRGGRNDQQTTVSKSKDVFTKEKQGKKIEIIAPFYYYTKKEYEDELDKIKNWLWKGYELGFTRTACWMCPFQKKEQWDAMKVYYPLLYEAMEDMVSNMEWRELKDDVYKKRMCKYWGCEE